MIKLNILYFASLGEALGTREETLTLDTDTTTVNDVKILLSARNELWQKNICGANQLLCALNKTIANPQSTISDGDELAFFPPVTGG